MKLISLVLLLAGLRAVDLATLKMSGVYDVQCTAMSNSHECVWNPEVEGELIPEARVLHVFDEIITFANDEHCQFDQDGANFANGFLLSTYVADETHTAPGAVYGDQYKGTQDSPSFAVLLLGADFAPADVHENCGQLLRLRKTDSEDRFQYAVVAAAVVDTQNKIPVDEIGLLVSPRFMSTACCESVTCLEEFEGHGKLIPANEDCSSETDFEIEVMADGASVAFGQGNLVMGTRTLPNDEPCPDYEQVEGELIAQAVQDDGTYTGFVSVTPVDVSAVEKCGKSFSVKNVKTEEEITVTIASFKDHKDPAVVDGTFYLRIEPEDCATLCGGECEGGRMGVPPPHCHLTFAEVGDETTEDLENTETTEEEEVSSSSGESSTSDESSTIQSSPTGPEGTHEAEALPWTELASCGEYSCLGGPLESIPTNCGDRADSPCFASMLGPEDKEIEEKTCGAVYELFNGEGPSIYIQIIDFAEDNRENQFRVSPHGLPTICPKACEKDGQTQCNATCEEDDDEVEAYCACVNCDKPTNPPHVQDTCKADSECEGCEGDCVQFPGSTKVVSVTVFAKYDSSNDLPPTASSAFAPVCAAAATLLI